MNKCLQCKLDTANPKFCNKSCAAKFNNTKSPKRRPESKCADCSLPCSTARFRCKACHKKWIDKRSIDKWESVTLGEMRGFGNANAGSRYPYIRTLSRKKYIKSGNPLSCYICNYDYHVDIAHIKDVSSFSDDTLISVVNSLDNLIPLCKNHHYEFDSGFLNIKL